MWLIGPKESSPRPRPRLGPRRPPRHAAAGAAARAAAGRREGPRGGGASVHVGGVGCGRSGSAAGRRRGGWAGQLDFSKEWEGQPLGGLA